MDDDGTPAALKSRTGSVLFTLGFDAEDAAAKAERVLDAAGHAPEREGRAVRVFSPDGSGAIVEVLRALQRRVPDPRSVTVREPTLDDVFLALTGHVPAPGGRRVPAAHGGAA